jgi:hypothetical protein
LHASFLLLDIHFNLKIRVYQKQTCTVIIKPDVPGIDLKYFCQNKKKKPTLPILTSGQAKLG